MKKTVIRLALVSLCLVMLFAFASCKDDQPDNSLIGTTTPAPVETTPAETTPAETTPAETTVHVHSYTSTVVAPTCTSAGYTLNVCACGDQTVTEPTAMLPHTYGAWTTVTAATCTAEGSQLRVCSACQASETQKIAVIGHSYVAKVTAPTKTTQGYTVHTCSVCSDSYTDSYTNATGSLGLSYSQNADGTLTITGMGLCTDTDVIIYSTNSEGKTVTAIAEGAFANNTTVKTIYLPSSVTSIGEGAFAGCTALTSISVEADNKNYAAVQGVLYSKALTTLVAFPAGLNVTEYTVSDSITEILPSAFAGCFNLTQFKLASTTNKLFYVYNGVLYKLDTNGVASTLLAYPAGRTETYFISNIATTVIENYAFYGARKLRTIDISGVINVGDYAFANCPDLHSVVIPDTTRKIGDYAFANCTALSSVTMGNSLRNVSYGAFSGCTSLLTVTIPDTVFEIEAYAFTGCTNLNTVIIGSGVDEIAEYAFMGCGRLSAVLFNGTANEWFRVDVDSTNNTVLTMTARLYFYTDSLTNPSTGSVYYWHYVNGVPSITW